MARKFPRELIRSLLDTAKSYLDDVEGWQSTLYTHQNRDGSIDGELKVPAIRGVKTEDLFITVEEAFPDKTYPRIWISVGMRFGFDDQESYYRYKGLSQVQTHYRRYKPSTKALVFLTAREIAVRPEGLEKKIRRKVDHIFVRLNWNAKSKQPRRK